MPHDHAARGDESDDIVYGRESGQGHTYNNIIAQNRRISWTPAEDEWWELGREAADSRQLSV